MSFDRMPSKSEVLGWNPHVLADFLKKMDLQGCDKVIIRNSMNGFRFLNMSENDLQNFPKIHAPLISKICLEIKRKEEKRGLFGKRSTFPKYHQPEMPSEMPGWGPGEFDSEDDNDYESPDEDDDNASLDYECPTEEIENEGEGNSDNDYEPPPSEVPEDNHHQNLLGQSASESVYIDNRRDTSVRGLPPVPCPRPSTGPSLPTLPILRPSSLTHQSREQPKQLPTKPPGPPAVDRNKKPSILERALNQSPTQGKPSLSRQQLNQPPTPGKKFNTVDKLAPHSQRAEEKVPESFKVVPPPFASSTVNRSNSSVTRVSPINRFGHERRNEVQEEGPIRMASGSNTFPLPSKNMAPRPSLHGPPVLPGPSKHADGLHPSIAGAGSLPTKLQEVWQLNRSSSRVVAEGRQVPPRPAQASIPPPQPATVDGQDMDSRWYIGQVNRHQAEGCLKKVNKDGAFLVRDSSKKSWEQPFTLMVLYQDKVYNIQIRRMENQYLLGTGLKVVETFSSVEAIIQHYSQSPLLLIDAKNREASQQNQCYLMYPAGY